MVRQVGTPTVRLAGPAGAAEASRYILGCDRSEPHTSRPRPFGWRRLAETTPGLGPPVSDATPLESYSALCVEQFASPLRAVRACGSRDEASGRDFREKWVSIISVGRDCSHSRRSILPLFSRNSTPPPKVKNYRLPAAYHSKLVHPTKRRGTWPGCIWASVQ